MARRGDQLREHILFTAKDVFLEMGYERTPMDAVASRAETFGRPPQQYGKVLNEPGDPHAADPVDRMSAMAQAVGGV
jgi:hypothetical protein